MLFAATATIAALVGVLIAEKRDQRAIVMVCKPIASTGFVAGGWLAGIDGPVETAVFIGLLLSWWGDVLLMPSGKKWFLAGLVAFLLGHIGFLTAFLVQGLSLSHSVLGLVGACLLAIPIGRWLLPQVDKAMQHPVLAYLIVITLMVAGAVGAMGTGASIWMPCAAFAFFLSDLSVAIDRFIRPSFLNRLWGLPLYYAAQWMFVVALMA